MGQTVNTCSHCPLASLRHHPGCDRKNTQLATRISNLPDAPGRIDLCPEVRGMEAVLSSPARWGNCGSETCAVCEAKSPPGLGQLHRLTEEKGQRIWLAELPSQRHFSFKAFWRRNSKLVLLRSTQQEAVLQWRCFAAPWRPPRHASAVSCQSPV